MKTNIMIFCSLKYDRSDNLGDEIQSLAAEQFLPRLDGLIDRDIELNDVKEPTFIIFNGWFKHGPDHWREGAAEYWPPSNQVQPGFFGFHIAYPELLTAEFLEYCRKWAPMGCRDKGTMEMLQEKGIEAYFSRCLTLTFPSREKDPSDSKVYIVEGQKHIDPEIIPEELRQNAVYKNHYISSKLKRETMLKRQMAQDLLDEYSSNARLIITNLLHCAMPCVAMRIPVVLITEYDPFYPAGYRLDPIEDILPLYEAGDDINWNPQAPDISDIANEIRGNMKTLISEKRSQFISF